MSGAGSKDSKAARNQILPRTRRSRTQGEGDRSPQSEWWGGRYRAPAPLDYSRSLQRRAAELVGQLQEESAAHGVEPGDVVIGVGGVGRVLHRLLVEQVVDQQRHPR